MLTSLKISDLTTTSIGKLELTITVHVTGKTITTRKLIRLRVIQEIVEFNHRQPVVFHILAQSSEKRDR